MYNPLIQLNHQRNDVLEGLRAEIDLWLSQRNHTQKLLATRANLSPQVLNDVIQHRRSVGPEMYEKLAKAIRSNGARIVGLQEMGQKVGKSMRLDESKMTVTYERHNKQLRELTNATCQDRNVGLFEINRSTKNLSK
jgi:hypothetical protein